MKKSILPLALALTVVFSGTALAASNVITSGGQTVASNPTTAVVAAVRASTNVIIVCSSGTTQYAAAAAHTQGTRTFGSTSGSTLIYWQDKASGTDITAATVANSDTGQFNTWTSL